MIRSIKEASAIFVHSDLDDYGLDPYEFRIYSRISRRAGCKEEAWESIPNIASGCKIGESRVRQALRLLEAVGLIESFKRPGRSTIYRLTPKHKWKRPENLETIRTSLSCIKSNTFSKTGSGSKTNTSIQSKTGVVSDLTPLPLSKVTDESIPLKENPIKVLPLRVATTQEESMGGRCKIFA